jgi:hypothetical protein
MPNTGEIDEPRIILKLLECQKKGISIPQIGKINEITDFQGIPYEKVGKKYKINKSPWTAKSDVIINGFGYSIKSTRSAPAAIVNHTTREKWMNVCEKVGVSIKPLDNMVEEYWNLVLNKGHGVDIKAYDEECPFGKDKKSKQYLKKLLNYFLFEGTGARDSIAPADFILDVEDPEDFSKWKVMDRDQAFDMMWPHLTFCVRNKGMPDNYPELDKEIVRLMKKWTRIFNGTPHGALHIRCGKIKKYKIS